MGLLGPLLGEILGDVLGYMFTWLAVHVYTYRGDVGLSV